SRAFADGYGLEVPLIGIGCIKGDPQEDEPRVMILATCFGPANPADGPMHPQAHRFREIHANGALLVFEGLEPGLESQNGILFKAAES
ncbi:MAG: hypothetical protein JJU24_17015, partial [Natronohydrobacter sp.]|nr:hypothetical protein [Natronohydrobacter sp.]